MAVRYIDIEAQNSIYNTYEIVTRGIAYTSRLISQQFKTVIDGDNYQKLQKSLFNLADATGTAKI